MTRDFTDLKPGDDSLSAGDINELFALARKNNFVSGPVNQSSGAGGDVSVFNEDGLENLYVARTWCETENRYPSHSNGISYDPLGIRYPIQIFERSHYDQTAKLQLIGAGGISSKSMVWNTTNCYIPFNTTILVWKTNGKWFTQYDTFKPSAFISSWASGSNPGNEPTFDSTILHKLPNPTGLSFPGTALTNYKKRATEIEISGTGDSDLKVKRKGRYKLEYYFQIKQNNTGTVSCVQEFATKITINGSGSTSAFYADRFEKLFYIPAVGGGAAVSVRNEYVIFQSTAILDLEVDDIINVIFTPLSTTPSAPFDTLKFIPSFINLVYVGYPHDTYY